MMQEVAAAPEVWAQYVAVDVVRFTVGRTIQAQSEIIGAMNRIVRSAVHACGIPDAAVIYSPAGDGISIALPEKLAGRQFSVPSDRHLRLGLRILEDLDAHNAAQTDPMRRFALRVGINEAFDNMVTDINGNASMAGAGINLAQRVMAQAGDCQIMLSPGSHTALKDREPYARTFCEYKANTKHGEQLFVYQFVGESPGVDTGSPPQFAPRKTPKMSLVAAYYMLHAQKNLGAVQLQGAENRDASVVCLYILALDSVDRAASPWHRPPTLRAYHANEATVAEQLAYYGTVDGWVVGSLANWVHSVELANETTLFRDRCFPTEAGLALLRTDWPDIAAQLSSGGSPAAGP